MPDGELRALGDLAAEYADKALTSTIEGVHTAVAARAFGAVGTGSAVAHRAHETISSGVYSALRLGSRREEGRALLSFGS